MWFPRLATNRVLRAQPVDGPFALVQRAASAERIFCLNVQAERAGLHRGMGLADARAFCPDLVSRPATPDLDARFLIALRRWATRYCPWVGLDGTDGLVLDISGAAHLWGNEAAMLADMRARMISAGLELRLGLANTRGAAWAFARHGEGARPLTALPVAALRLDATCCTALERLGLRCIGDLAAAPRAPLARRFGAELLMRLDQALGRMPEPVTPAPEPPHYGVRLTLPDPIGLQADVMAATARLLEALCDKLRAQEAGARQLALTLRRVDRGSTQVDLRLAAAMRDPARILPLFERGVAGLDAGFGIDQMRLDATLVEPLPARQTGLSAADPGGDRLNDLITRIGTRIGLDNVLRFLPADSHIPERSFLIVPAAQACSNDGAAAMARGGWPQLRPRPLRLFRPEPIAASGRHPPERFHWRRVAHVAAHVVGPERIAPEWWLDDPDWRSGLRDYWQVHTRQGRRLWLFHTPQSPGWFVHGEFA